MVTAASSASGPDPAALEALIPPELQRWGVPGVEVALVRGDEVVFAGGFGARDPAHGLPVTERTLFHHGSTGKAFTALLAAVLVDEGLLEWERPLRDVVPDLRFHDPVLTERVTLRDLLAHRSGLARHELAWVANPGWDRAELIRRLRFLEASRDLRAEFQYCNLGYAAAGHVIGVVTGSTWEEQLRTRVLEPLGMSGATSSVAEALGRDDIARPHELLDGSMIEVPFRVMDACAPAGQVLASAPDSARWLRFQVNDGELDGVRLASREVFAQTRTLQIPLEAPGPLPDEPDWGPSWLGYGLGWVLARYRDRPAIYHSGGVDGFRTDTIVMTEDRVGVLVCANAGSGLPLALALDLTDRLLGGEPRPWLDRLHAREETLRRAADDAPAPTVVADTTPSHGLAEFAGDYEHPGYGTLHVTAERSALRFRLGELDFSAKHRHHDTWMARYDALELDVPVTFVTDADGMVAEARAGLEPTLPPIAFVRRADPRLRVGG
jgi:CubicO group peptidase (beta-lactamase class C family)